MTDLFSMRYPAVPGHRNRDTSRAAAVSMRATAPTLRSRVMAALERHDMTADECAVALGETCLAVRPRLTELSRLGLIEDSGVRATNASGRRAIVWRAQRRETFANTLKPLNHDDD